MGGIKNIGTKNKMSKILESLPLTIVAGIVLTIIMVFATNYLENRDQPDAAKAVSDMMK
ncbi:hypothetical protein [Emcibacter sp.]|uniref:hypothetical protein n=1 Tax=Emcibacter sp. TaxID=1979954 RepID=UPI002AA75E77|nr:hypothetical protein [Emcibacter sp.]